MSIGMTTSAIIFGSAVPLKIRLPGKSGDADFTAAYHACLAGQPVPKQGVAITRPIIDRKSLRWLCQQYLTNRHFQNLDVKTRRPRQSILTQLCDLPVSDTSKAKIGDVPFEDIHSKAIRRIRDRHADRPEATIGSRASRLCLSGQLRKNTARTIRPRMCQKLK